MRIGSLAYFSLSVITYLNFTASKSQVTNNFRGVFIYSIFLFLENKFNWKQRNRSVDNEREAEKSL